MALCLLYGLVQLLRISGVPVLLSPVAAGRLLTQDVTPTPTLTTSVPITQPPTLTPTLYLPVLFESAYLYFPWVHFTPTWFRQPQPADGATAQSLNVNFAWVDDPSAPQPLRYEIHLQVDQQDAPVRVYPSAQSHLDPPTLDLATSYRWQVVGIDGDGNRLAGPIWRFTTEGPFSPDNVEAMVRIPAGEFRMGCDPTNSMIPKPCWDREVPLHTVFLDTYEIDKYEVTNQEYRACVAAGVCAGPAYSKSRKRSDYFGNQAYNLYPVLYVSWWNAQDFCRWQGKRLPTEAEWEKAARGNIDTRVWPWGDEFPDCTRINFSDNSTDPWTVCVDDTVQVGSYPTGATPYGVMDMGGNVFEWVNDVYDEGYYKVSPYANPPGPDGSKLGSFKGNLFVIRGGSYRIQWFYPMVYHRHWGHHGEKPPRHDAPFYRNDQVGFRCARSVAE